MQLPTQLRLGMSNSGPVSACGMALGWRTEALLGILAGVTLGSIWSNTKQASGLWDGIPTSPCLPPDVQGRGEGRNAELRSCRGLRQQPRPISLVGTRSGCLDLKGRKRGS